MAFATVFPGQGSQSVGMLASLSDSFPLVKQTFEEASEVLDQDLWALTVDGSEKDLNSTVNTQPVMLSAGVAVWRVWLAQGGGQPTGLAGHSLGEYSALVASGAMGFTDAIRLVKTRAELMQQAVPEEKGAMAAILGLEDALIIKACAQASEAEIVQAVNFNSPGQVVIAGNKDAVARAMKLALEAGAKRAIDLPVSVPSHCDLMIPAAKQLAVALEATKISGTTIPVLHNVDATTSPNSEEIRTALSEQLYKPVQWVNVINNLKLKLNANIMIECGPGKVLFGLNRRIDRTIKTICVHDPASLEKGLLLCEENLT